MRRLEGISAVCLATLLVSCDGRIQAGSIFESLDGDVKYIFRGDGIVDYQEDGSVFAGKYSYINDGRIRVEIVIFGTSVPMILEPIDRGLVQIDENGHRVGILFDSESIEPARCEHLRGSAAELIADFKKLNGEGSGFSWDNWLRQVQSLGKKGVFTKESLRAGTHAALKVKRVGCKEVLVWDSQGDVVYLRETEAETHWATLAKSFAEEQAALEAEARRQEEERAVALEARRAAFYGRWQLTRHAPPGEAWRQPDWGEEVMEIFPGGRYELNGRPGTWSFNADDGSLSLRMGAARNTVRREGDDLGLTDRRGGRYTYIPIRK